MKKIIYIIIFLFSAQISKSADSKSATVGQKVTISVTAKGTTPFKYQWYKDGKPIVGAVNQTHVMTSVVLADAGTYSCALSNNKGGTQSDNAVLSVAVPEVAPSEGRASILVE